MQKKILIIGNGFDLYHKLPTGYKDFLFLAKHWEEFKKEYDKKDTSRDNKTGETINVRLGNKNELTSESLKDFASHASLFSKEHIDYLDEHLKDNAWLTYFEKITLPGHNWIDFESEIERALIQVELYYHQFLPTVNNDIPMRTMPELMKEVIYTFSDIPEKAGINYVNLAKSIFHSNRDADPEKLHPHKIILLSSMKDELDALNKCLNYYLLEFVSIINCGVYSEQIKELGDISLLNFNYTYTYAMVYGKNALLQHHPIHGEAKEGNLVLGIPDESFRNSMDYVYFQKFFQRIQKKTGNFYKAWPVRPEHPTLGDAPVQVFIMGHSLNKVDKGVLKDFFQECNVETITIFYHNQSGYESQVINLVDMFGRDFVIDQTGKGRIVFEKLDPPVTGDPRTV